MKINFEVDFYEMGITNEDGSLGDTFERGGE